MPIIQDENALRRLFASLTESTFQVELGVADPPLIDYLVNLCMRFVRMDEVFRIRSTDGRRLEEVTEMMAEAEERQGRTRREVYRHIGDIILFWAGLYPEALKNRQGSDRRDHLIDYFEQGKRGYWIASTYDDEPYEDEAPVLRRLSHDFELCTFGLNRVRAEWEKQPEASADHSPQWN